MTCQLGPNFLSRTSWGISIIRINKVHLAYLYVFRTKFVVGCVVITCSVTNFHDLKSPFDGSQIFQQNWTHFFFHVLVHICVSDHRELVASSWGDVCVCHSAVIFLKQQIVAWAPWDLLLLCSCPNQTSWCVQVLLRWAREGVNWRCRQRSFTTVASIEDDQFIHTHIHLIGRDTAGSEAYLLILRRVQIDESRAHVSDPAAAAGAGGGWWVDSPLPFFSPQLFSLARWTHWSDAVETFPKKITFQL